MFGLLKKIFGTKQDKDVQAFQARVIEINQYFDKYNSLSNDQLRNKTLEFKERIKEYLSNIDQEINDLKDRAASIEDIHEKEEIYNTIDSKNKERNEHLEEVLRNILPEAFAVVKETARRFKENTLIEVTATEQDRNLSVSKSYINLQGDRAIYSNSWTAAGGEVVWNMLHYDSQLIGGMVLHEGKIAEMATGEGKTLVATLPAYLNGLSGNGVHIVTVNDYLAKRDSE